MTCHDMTYIYIYVFICMYIYIYRCMCIYSIYICKFVEGQQNMEKTHFQTHPSHHMYMICIYVGHTSHTIYIEDICIFEQHWYTGLSDLSLSHATAVESFSTQSCAQGGYGTARALQHDTSGTCRTHTS